jgi:hypothetical protein
VDINVKLNRKNISDFELLSDIKRVADEYRLPSVSITEYKRFGGRFSHTTFTDRFGGWNKTMEKLGLAKNQQFTKTSVNSLFENLLNVWEKLGRQPTCDEMHSPLSVYAFKPYITQFQTWNKTLEHFSIWFKTKYKTEYENLLDQTPKDPIATKRTPPASLRNWILRRDRYKCQKCGASPANDPSVILTIDHIIPFSKGGKTVADNLQTLCRACNAEKGARYNE